MSSLHLSLLLELILNDFLWASNLRWDRGWQSSMLSMVVAFVDVWRLWVIFDAIWGTDGLSSLRGRFIWLIFVRISLLLLLFLFFLFFLIIGYFFWAVRKTDIVVISFISMIIGFFFWAAETTDNVVISFISRVRNRRRLMFLFWNRFLFFLLWQWTAIMGISILVGKTIQYIAISTYSPKEPRSSILAAFEFTVFHEYIISYFVFMCLELLFW